MSIKLFLADDHAVVRDGMQALVGTEHDLTVVGVAANGCEAVRRVGKLKPDIVIMDIAMPELNGIEATTRITQACPLTRVIILSMHDTTEHIFRALKAGAKGYLLKETAGREVIAAIRSVHSGDRYLSKSIEKKVIDDYVFQRQISAVQSPIEKLSSRELEILQLVVEGKSSAAIAEKLLISSKTVETYRSRMTHKIGVKNLPGLVKFAIQHGLTPLDLE